MTSGATATLSEFVPLQTTGGWHHGAAQQSLPGPTRTSYLRTGVLWHGAHSLDSFVRVSLSSGAHSPAQTSTTAEACFRSGQPPTIQLHRHSTLPRKTAGLPSPSPDVGFLFARDRTRRELFHQMVLRLCHHKARPRAPAWGGSELVTLVHYSVFFRVPDSDILPSDDMTEVLVVGIDLFGTTLTFVDVCVPPRPHASGTMPPILISSWRIVMVRLWLLTLTPTIPPAF